MTDRNTSDPTHDRLMTAARRLPREITPGRDLWPAIAARIGDEDAVINSGGRWRLAGAIAAAVGLVTISSLITLWVTDDPAPVIVQRAPIGSVAVPARARPVEAGFGAGFTLGPRYERARRELTRDLDAQLGGLPEETQALVNRNLQQIRSALAEINTELSRDPNNVLLQQLLMAAYQDELAMLMNMNRMVQTMPTRTEI